MLNLRKKSHYGSLKRNLRLKRMRRNYLELNNAAELKMREKIETMEKKTRLELYFSHKIKSMLTHKKSQCHFKICHLDKKMQNRFNNKS